MSALAPDFDNRITQKSNVISFKRQANPKAAGIV